MNYDIRLKCRALRCPDGYLIRVQKTNTPNVWGIGCNSNVWYPRLEIYLKSIRHPIGAMYGGEEEMTTIMISLPEAFPELELGWYGQEKGRPAFFLDGEIEVHRMTGFVRRVNSGN